MASIKNIIETKTRSGTIKATGYDSAENYFTCSGPKVYLKTFAMMLDVLSGIKAVAAVEGSSSDIPNVKNIFKRGTKEHAHEICATMQQLEDDVFVAHDGKITFVAIGSDADGEKVANIFQKF